HVTAQTVEQDDAGTSGELSWNATTKTLTVSGTIFIDGSAKVSNGALNTYNGQATLYLSGTFLANGSLCGAVSGTTCNFAGWNPDKELLMIVANGNGGQVNPGDGVFVGNNFSFEGGLYATNAVEFGNNVNIDGLAVGSFVNVVAARLPLRRSVVHPRSACMSCGNELAWHDNVPLLSYALLRGRCRSCGVRIGLLYPAVELATALLVVACFVRFGLSGRAAVAAFFCVVLVAISAIDLIHRIIPNRIVVPAAALVLVAQTALRPSPEWALASLGAALFLFVAALAYPAG